MSNFDDDFSEYEFCNKYLEADEYVQWTGKPENGFYINFSNGFRWLFSAFWMAFCTYFIYLVIRERESVQLLIFAALFWLFGAYFLVWKNCFSLALRFKTYYVITNKRVIIKKGKKIRFYNGENLDYTQTTMHRNGNGTITFSRLIYTTKTKLVKCFALENISDVSGAQRAISSLTGNETREYDKDYEDVKFTDIANKYPKFTKANMTIAKGIGVFMLAVLVFMAVKMGTAVKEAEDYRKEINETISYSDVADAVEDRGYKTRDVQAKYEDMDMVHHYKSLAGVKENSCFEFHQYTEDGSPDGVYDTIVFGFTGDTSPDAAAQFETPLENGKKFEKVYDDTRYVVAYKDNTVVYAEEPVNSNDVDEILDEIGYE